MVEECNKCKAAGFSNQIIGFQKIGEDPVTGKKQWKLLNDDGTEHKHRQGPKVIDTTENNTAEILRIVKRIEEKLNNNIR